MTITQKPNVKKLSDYWLHCLRNYAVFSGRARRREFWSFRVVNAIFFILFAWVDRVLGLAPVGLQDAYLLAIMIPELAVTWRRLHDTGRSGEAVVGRRSQPSPLPRARAGRRHEAAARRISMTLARKLTETQNLLSVMVLPEYGPRWVG